MKQHMWVVMGIAAGSVGFAQTPVIPSFTNEPLAFVPTPMRESSPSELITLLDAPTPWRKLVSPDLPAATSPTRVVPHMLIVEPKPNLEYAMPIVTPNPDIDYKLHILEFGPAPSDQRAK